MLDKTMLVFGQMNEPPGARMRVALSGPDDGRVLPRRRRARTCCCSSTTSSASSRPAPRSRRCSAGCRRQVGYQPTLETEMGELQERITSTSKGSVTSIQAIYVPADDLTDPAPAVGVRPPQRRPPTLSRSISEKGIYPAVDPLDSTSTILKPEILGEEHFDVANRGPGGAAALQGAAGHHRHPRHRRAVRRGQGDGQRGPARSSASSPSRSIVAEQFTGTPGEYVPVAETIRGFKEILEGKHDDLPERAFFMKGSIDEVVASRGQPRRSPGPDRAAARGQRRRAESDARGLELRQRESASR